MHKDAEGIMPDGPAGEKDAPGPNTQQQKFRHFAMEMPV